MEHRRPDHRVSAETLELLEKLNFENWMHYNKVLVGMLYLLPRKSTQLRKDERLNGTGRILFKTLQRGIEFGALILDSWMGVYLLTEKARKFYEETMR